MSDQRPSFIECWFDDTKASGKNRGWFVTLVPWTVGSCAALSAAASYFTPVTFFFPSNWDVSATVLTGLLAFNALTLALAWGAIGRIYESVSQPGFSSYLRAGGVLATYLFYISYIHLTQVTAALVSLVTLVVLFMPVPLLCHQILFGMTLATTLYALRWALGAVTVVQDLSWHFATYDGLAPEDKNKLRLAVSNNKP